MHPGDMAVLVIPIDKAAPKGRLILPQQQVIRDILEAEGAAVCVKEYELRETLEKFKEPPAIVITDSQAFCKGICGCTGKYSVDIFFYSDGQT